MPRLNQSISNSVFITLILAAGLCAALAPAARAAEPRDLAQLLPADTMVVINVRDVPGLMRKWDASPFGRFYDDPRAEAFFRPLRGEIDGFQRRLGLDPSRLRGFFSGQLVLAGIATGKSKGALEWVLMARHNGDPQVLARLKRPPAPPGTTLRRIANKVGPYDITRLEIIRTEAAEIPSVKSRPKKRKSAMPSLDLEDLGQGAREAAPLTLERQVSEEYEDYFGPSLMIHAGTKGRPLARILERLAESGDPEGATTRPEFIKLRQILGDGDIEVQINSGTLAGAAFKSDRKGLNLLGFNPAGLGLREVRASGLKLSLESGRAIVAGALLSPEPRSGIARALFLPDGPPPDAAALIPPEAVGYSSLAMPLPKLWRMAKETLQVVSPAVWMLLDAQFRSFEQRTGLKVDKALAGHLGGGVVRFALPAGASSGAHPTETTMVALRDGAAFRDALRTLLQFSAMIGGYHLEVEKGGKAPIWTVVEGAPNTPGAESGRPLLTLCVTDDWLLIGEGSQGVNAVLARMNGANAAASLKTQRVYRQVTGQLPEGRFATAVLGRGELYKKAVQTLLSLATLAGEESEFKSGGLTLNGGRAPEPRVWDEFFGPAGAALSRQGQDAIRLDAFFEYGGK